jgi:2-polyprenyl-3-methyl-5-hydroxy-6-metoxy-1,4-benzoquinol methylase
MTLSISLLQHGADIPAHKRYRFKALSGSSHSWALKHLEGKVRGKRILDIGAGSGWLGERLRLGSYPAKLVAVEIDNRAHETLANSYELVVSSIDELAMHGAAEPFDYVVVLDLLEHLATPLEYLKRLRGLLAPGGRILISVPNVAHWSVRFPLFFWGSFEYRSLGILDGTHLHFFSKRGLLKLLSQVPRVKIEETSASIEPFELALPEWVAHNPVYLWLIPVRHALARAFPGLMAYQHLVLVSGLEG